MRDAHTRRARARWYHGSDRHGKCRLSIPVRPVTATQVHDRRSRPVDLVNAVYDDVLWIIGYALMLVPVAFLFILPHLLIAGRHWR
jgi:hypothetical protein